jgi:hypothetical protein
MVNLMTDAFNWVMYLDRPDRALELVIPGDMYDGPKLCQLVDQLEASGVSVIPHDTVNAAICNGTGRYARLKFPSGHESWFIVAWPSDLWPEWPAMNPVQYLFHILAVTCGYSPEIRDKLRREALEDIKSGGHHYE